MKTWIVGTLCSYVWQPCVKSDSHLRAGEEKRKQKQICSLSSLNDLEDRTGARSEVQQIFLMQLIKMRPNCHELLVHCLSGLFVCCGIIITFMFSCKHCWILCNLIIWINVSVACITLCSTVKSWSVHLTQYTKNQVMNSCLSLKL